MRGALLNYYIHCLSITEEKTLFSLGKDGTVTEPIDMEDPNYFLAIDPYVACESMSADSEGI